MERPKLFYYSRVCIQSVKHVMWTDIKAINISFINSTLLRWFFFNALAYPKYIRVNKFINIVITNWTINLFWFVIKSPIVTYMNLLNIKFSKYALQIIEFTLYSWYITLKYLLNFFSFIYYGLLQKNIQTLRIKIRIIVPRLKKVKINPKFSPSVPYSKVK